MENNLTNYIFENLKSVRKLLLQALLSQNQNKHKKHKKKLKFTIKTLKITLIQIIINPNFKAKFNFPLAVFNIPIYYLKV